MRENPNLEILESVVHSLGSLNDRMVFVGGCASGLLLTDPAAPPLRVTRDVDALVEVASLADYHKLHAKLRKKGFTEDLGDRAPICRWKKESLLLDIMPTDPSILGFGNRWFSMAFSEAETLPLPSGVQIRILTAPYFLATKLEAFDSRGTGDYFMSRDMADVIAVLDGRKTIVPEVEAAKPSLRSYLANRFSTLLETQSFLDSMPGHLPSDDASQSRSLYVLERARAIARCDPQ